MNLLPGAADAVIDTAKVRDYLLNPGNLQNGGKAALFKRFGFKREAWELLSAALRQHGVDNEVVGRTNSAHGAKFVVRCNLVSPDGRNPCLTTVWIVDLGASLPRLVTAY